MNCRTCFQKITPRQHWLKCCNCQKTTHRTCHPTRMTSAKFWTTKPSFLCEDCTPSNNIKNCIECKKSINDNSECLYCCFPPIEVHEIFDPLELDTNILTSPVVSHTFSFEKGIKFSYLNCQGITNKLCNVKSFLSDYDFHILSCSETWLSNGDLTSNYEITNYELQRFDRKTKRGGGHLIYIRNDCIFSQIKLNVDFPAHTEFFCFKIKVPHVKPFLFISVYCPPNVNKNSFLDSLEFALEHLNNYNLEII